MAINCCFGFLSRNSRQSLIVPDETNMKYDVLPRYKPRQVLSSEYIRMLIDNNYEPTSNWFDFASINGITAFLQREYSPLINSDMVYEALLLEPHYKISYRMDAPGCRFIRHKTK